MEDTMQFAALANAFNSKTNKILIGSVIGLLALIVVVFLIVKFKSKFKDMITNTKLVNNLETEIKTDDITLTQAQFNSYASALYSAMKGWGTDEEKIYNVFRQMNTRSDVLQLIKVFGVKDGDTLTEWLNDDLSASEIEKINTILATNDINYSF